MCEAAFDRVVALWEGIMRFSYLPRWKFTDSCGQPRAPGTLLCGCADHNNFGCNQATRRKFMATAVAVAGAGGFSKILDPMEAFAQGRVFPAPPPEVSPVAGMMDTHIHSEPDVFGRNMDDDPVSSISKERGMEAI